MKTLHPVLLIVILYAVIQSIIIILTRNTLEPFINFVFGSLFLIGFSASFLHGQED